MKELSNTLKPFIKTNIDVYKLTSILKDEEYIDEEDIPIMCQYCDSENLEKRHKIEFITLEDNFKQQIKDIYPDIDDNSIITFWICVNCGSIVAIKPYTHKNMQEKRIYHHKFDSFSQIINDLKNQGYVESNNEPCKCWYCNSDKIEIKKDEDREIAKCGNCSKVLGYNYSDWFLKVENEN